MLTLYNETLLILYRVIIEGEQNSRQLSRKNMTMKQYVYTEEEI